MYIANWRPISLINVDVKIASKALAKRLECILPFIIHRNQNAYVKGRLISDSTRIIDDIMSYTKVNDLSGLLVAIDFEKAFDSLDWAFLNKALLAFNFGESFIKWVSTFYCNIKSCVTNNGFSSVHFHVKRGVRQGDPLSPYLFIIALEILAINIRSSKNIKGFKLSDNEEIKLTIFADDLTTFLKDKQSFENLLKMLRDFGCCSGLKVNNGKLEALHLGDSSIKLDIGIKNMDKPLKKLGIFFSYDKKQAVKLNFDSILDSLKKTLNLWKWRHLTILGRIQIIKSFAIPKFLYRASQLPFPDDVIKRANTIIYEFIWKDANKTSRDLRLQQWLQMKRMSRDSHHTLLTSFIVPAYKSIRLFASSHVRDTGRININAQRLLFRLTSAHNGAEFKDIDANFLRSSGHCRLFVVGVTQGASKFVHKTPKRSKKACAYYSNSTAARQILLMGGDISINPGPTNDEEKN
ncbi:hypothetical protein ACROYT_G025128 [Oculina patagonica]